MTRAKVTVTADVAKRCPYKDELDTGTVTLTFLVQHDAPELHQLAAELAEWRGQAASHEEFTRAVLTTYRRHGCVAVRSVWRTAGMEVACDVPSD